MTTTRRANEITYQLADAHVGRIVDDAIHHAGETAVRAAGATV